MSPISKRTTDKISGGRAQNVAVSIAWEFFIQASRASLQNLVKLAQEARIRPCGSNPQAAVTLYPLSSGKIEKVNHNDDWTTIQFSLEEQTFLLLRGPSPHIICKTEVEIDTLWQNLSYGSGTNGIGGVSLE